MSVRLDGDKIIIVFTVEQMTYMPSRFLMEQIYV